MKSATVCIVGTPNVGKSSIFNRMVGKRSAIVDDEAGITRDRLYGICEWLGRSFRVVDTGGIEISNAPFQQEIRAQVEIALEEADAILFVVDGIKGMSQDDLMIAKMLYKAKAPIFLAVNKVDDIDKMDMVSDFYALGFKNIYPISASHGIGIGDLLDALVEKLPLNEEEVMNDDVIRFSVIGRPNVGKSSLINALLGEERVIVSNIEGTTRDAIDSEFIHEGRRYVAIDTAGLKRRGKIYESVDKYAALRAISAIERSEIVLLVIDGSEGVINQDKHVVGYALEAKKPVIIVVNKWDLVEHTQKAMQEFVKKIRVEFKFLDYAFILFVSAKNHSRIQTIFPAILKSYESYHRHVTTSVLNEVLDDAQAMNPPSEFNKGRLKIYYGTQSESVPPTFVLFVNSPSYLHFSYERYLENRIRGAFDFEGSPIQFVLKERKN